MVGGALAGKGALIGHDDKIDGTAGTVGATALLEGRRGRDEGLFGAEFGTGVGTGAEDAC